MTSDSSEPISPGSKDYSHSAILKRSRYQSESLDDVLLLNRPSKLSKSDDSTPTHEHPPEVLSEHIQTPTMAAGTTFSIRRTLPEISEEEVASWSNVTNISELRSSVLEMATHTNTIAYLPKLSNVDTLCYDFLGWTVGQAKESGDRRPALFVVDKEKSLGAHATYIQTSLPHITCATCTAAMLNRDLSDLLKHDVIVSTSQNLLEIFSRGAMKMDQIHAIIIEDAQHIKSNDCYSFLPIVQLMTTFYSACPPSYRPRIFAVALCVDLSMHAFDSRALKLEATLDAWTYGVSPQRRDEVLNLPDRPNETVVLYDSSPVDRISITPLFAQLQTLDPDKLVLGKYFREAEDITAEIGTCASDLTFRRALTDFEIDLSSRSEDESGSLKAIWLQLKDAITNWTYSMPNPNPSSAGFNVTHKFLRLIQVLEACADYGEDFRGIILVQKKSTALAMVETLKMLQERLKFVSPLGVWGSMGVQAQERAWGNFASGHCNVLVITKSIPELGVPKASVVVRYDLMESHLLYGQTRACARGRESHLIHLVERHSDSQRQVLINCSSAVEEIDGWMNSLRDSDTVLVPPVSLHEPPICYDSESEDSEERSTDESYIGCATTGGRVYPRDALATLIRYVSKLRKQGRVEANRSIFEFHPTTSTPGRSVQYICTVSLPDTPLHGVSGTLAPNKHAARRSAAFAACKALSSQGNLDYRIVPLAQSRMPTPIHQDGGSRLYPRKTADFWKNSGLGPVTTLHPTVIHIEGQRTSYAPLILLTRQAFPPLPTFDLFPPGDRVTVKAYRGRPFNPNVDDMSTIHNFTMRLLKTAVNKAAISSIEHAPYFFAALSPVWRPANSDDFVLPDIVSYMDREAMTLANDNFAVPIQHMSSPDMEEELEDTVIQDRWTEFTRRYFTVKVRRDLTPLSKPADALREIDYDSLLSYVAERKKDKGFVGLKDLQQPIVEVETISSIVNALNPRGKNMPDTTNLPKYLIPELCAKFTISASLMRTIHLWPSLMWKVDDLLVVKELNMQYFDHKINETLLYEAITTISAEMEQNYERLELLGDAFLKYLASIVAFVNNPSQNEGSLHIARQAMISNRALTTCATKIGIPSYVRSKPLLLRMWRPWAGVLYHQNKKEGDGVSNQAADEVELVETEVIPPAKPQDPEPFPPPPPQPDVKGSGNDIVSKAEDGVEATRKRKKRKKSKRPIEAESNWQSLGDKVIADVAEAILGAAYLSGGRELGLAVAKDLSLPLPGIITWSDFGSKVVISYNEFDTAHETRAGSIAAVEGIIGHQFRQPHLLAQVLAHNSVVGKVLSYERLEFLGDAILDFMVIRYIYDRERTLAPGGLSMLKSAMVSNSTLGAICVLSGIYRHLLFPSAQLSETIQRYAKAIIAKAEKEYEVAEQEGRPPGQFWEGTDPPKALSDVIESIIGAVYISDGFMPVGAEAFFDKVLQPFFDRHISLETLSHHPTKTLFEYIQALGCGQLNLDKVNSERGGLSTCRILIHGTEFARASDELLPVAARKASARALNRFKEDGSFLLATCDCRTGPQNKSVVLSQGFEDAISSLEKSEEPVAQPAETGTR